MALRVVRSEARAFSLIHIMTCLFLLRFYIFCHGELERRERDRKRHECSAVSLRERGGVCNILESKCMDQGSTSVICITDRGI